MALGPSDFVRVGFLWFRFLEWFGIIAATERIYGWKQPPWDRVVHACNTRPGVCAGVIAHLVVQSNSVAIREPVPEISVQAPSAAREISSYAVAMSTVEFGEEACDFPRSAPCDFAMTEPYSVSRFITT